MTKKSAHFFAGIAFATLGTGLIDHFGGASFSQAELDEAYKKGHEQGHQQAIADTADSVSKFIKDANDVFYHEGVCDISRIYAQDRILALGEGAISLKIKDPTGVEHECIYEVAEGDRFQPKF